MKQFITEDFEIVDVLDCKDSFVILLVDQFLLE